MLCANCGKSTKRAVVVDRFDLTALAGLPAAVERMRVYRCASCGNETVAGPDLEQVLAALAIKVAAREGRLTGAEARFLRKRLGFTQDELGARLGAHKVTISDWERGDTVISQQYDYILRGFVFSRLLGDSPTSVPSQIERLERDLIRKALEKVHEAESKTRRPVVVPFLMNAANEKSRAKRN